MVNRAMNVKVTDYDKQLYTEEANKLREVFKDQLVEIHHIGSTAVPNLKAKPIIDIMPIVKDIDMVDTFNERMSELGYEPLGELGIRGRRYFRKGGENRTHQVHVFQFDNEVEMARHLAVRDYLKAHNKDVLEYGRLKERLASEFPRDIEGYSAGKDDFVKNLEQKALQWRQREKGIISQTRRNSV